MSAIVSGTNIYSGTYGNGIFCSTDNGDSWSVTGLAYGDIRSIAVIGTNIFAGTEGGVFLSTNNGTNWQAVNSGLTNNKVYAFATYGTNLFAGTWGGGIFTSNNNGNSWQAVNSGLGYNYILSLIIYNNILYTGTGGGGIWKRPVSEMITSVPYLLNKIPDKFTLYQNYPNPFNTTTTIKFDLPIPSFITLKVYDLLGEEIITLINEQKIAGKYEVNFNASSLSSGIYIYIYHLNANNQVATKKLLLIK